MLLPQEIMLHISQTLYDEYPSAGDPDELHDLVSLSISTKAWRSAVLPCKHTTVLLPELNDDRCPMSHSAYADLYSHCSIKGRGNFALENWITRLLPKYGHFTRSIDVSLCWMYALDLPQREREQVQAGHNSLVKPWESARDILVSRVLVGLSNLSTVRISTMRCINTPAAPECACLNYWECTAQSFQYCRLSSLSFHGTAANFCPRLSRLILTHSAQSIRSILFSDDIDGCPSHYQPFEQLAQLPALKRVSLAVTSIRSYAHGGLNWVSSLEEVTVANGVDHQATTQPLSVGELNWFLGKVSASLRSLILQDVCIGNSDGGTLVDLPQLNTLKLQGTRDVNFETLNILGAHGFRYLSLAITPAVKPAPLLNCLTSGAFPGLKQLWIHFKEEWNRPIRWNVDSRAEVRAACEQRNIELIVTDDKRPKETLAKVRVRRRVRE